MSTVNLSKALMKAFLRTHETKNLSPITDEVRLEKMTSAFFRWASMPLQPFPDARHALWNEYCDVRDNLPPGTTAKKFSGSYENPSLRFMHTAVGVKH